ncbi:hypothetical protein [Rubellicoccus peritrichatus]|uniref:CobW/HypB/UreG nucleotide-binding domain-containing protein n=1 Tax=Rubellicoccus peritrichatus TaxID=3080537 RepID=A0AAQ3L8Y9_9BACT|nr:hypothetical protein [Puniceicoccus sp. CR14]WOO40827.1 hypothetical protein RZN69_19560 [Puniceicoccus sp. CR14]
MSSDVYFVLGSSGSGRREVVVDLIEGGFDAGDNITVAVANSEKISPMDEQLSARQHTEVVSYDYPADVQIADDSTLFLIARGDTEPGDEIETFQSWLKQSGANLCRILMVTDCSLAEREPKLEPWFDCCIHFSDVVLLNRRETVSPKWMRAFEKRYTSMHLPCLFELVKKGRVANPAQVLDPLARRYSLLFDDIDAVDQMDFDPNNLPEETIDLVAPADPWLERLPSGQRAKPVPDIREYLAKD